MIISGDGTALLDPIGRVINETGERLAGMDEKDRLGLVSAQAVIRRGPGWSSSVKTNATTAPVQDR